jgi:SAM-dependent methyltransferase
LAPRQQLSDDARRLRDQFPGDAYVGFHAPRFAALLRLLDDYVKPGMTVLDIGRSPLTGMLHERFQVRVDALGFYKNEPSAEGHNWWFDLNLAADQATWRTDLPQYEVIVMGEVIEHLHTAPRLVLSFLRSLLTVGGVLIIQTPNAAVLHKRVELLVGRNPYELIRERQNDPGHFREYTRKELVAAVEAAGLKVEQWFAADYLDYSRKQNAGPRAARLGKVVNFVYKYAPPSLKPGQTVVARRLD